MNININENELTVGQAKAIASMFRDRLVTADLTNGREPWQIGNHYLIRTVTHHIAGKLTMVTGQELALEAAAWIPDDGRFTQAVETGNFKEVEPFPKGRIVIVGRGSVIDAVTIPPQDYFQK